jgi:FlaA1/EpsC-like NDP-sugar epimerase
VSVSMRGEQQERFEDRLIVMLAPWRGPLQATLDLIALGVAIGVSAYVLNSATSAVISGFVFGAIVHVFLGILFGSYLGRERVGTYFEITRLVVLFAVSTLGVNLGLDVLSDKASWRLGLVTMPMAILFGSIWRAAYRGWRAERQRPKGAQRRVIVFGAGEAGEHILRAMMTDPESIYVPVAVLDDSERKVRRRVHGLRVVGGRSSLPTIFAQYNADTLLIAIPSAPDTLLREIWELAEPFCADIRTLPRLADLGGRINVGQIEPVTVEDVLGRRKIDLDLEAIASHIRGKTVLVTGAGGSIGSELCRQLSRLGPAELVKLDRDESGLHGMQLSLDGTSGLSSPNLVVADIRDRQRMFDIFSTFKPHVVFHAAALKHVPLLELHPIEGVKTNVFGTLNVLEAALANGVERFVNISTDKAADPINVLGCTKRIAERLTATIAAGAPSGRFLSVRFGNVLGSRGSMMETFQGQVNRGGPITVTHADVTRYFMTISEAVQLTIQAADVGRNGEALILDMGSPMRILSIAEQFARKTQPPLEIIITGLRPGEKMHEVLIGPDEVGSQPFHHLITHVPVPELDCSNLRDLLSAGDDAMAQLLTTARQPAAHSWMPVAGSGSTLVSGA